MKATLFRTPLGSIAHGLRDRLELLRAARARPEQAGTIANDLISRLLLERLCADGRRFVDVGAHIGSVIDGVRRHSRPSAIDAVEAIPAKADALRRLFPKVTVHCCAVGDEEGETSFFVADRQSGYSSLDPELASRQAGVRSITVPMRRLDSLVPHRDVDLIKLDVEGAELGVLRGAEAVVATSRPTIMFESGPDEIAGFPHVALWQWLEQHDYAVLVPNRVAHNDAGLTQAGFLEAHLYPLRTTNYFAVARERRDEVRLRAFRLLKL